MFSQTLRQGAELDRHREAIARPHSELTGAAQDVLTVAAWPAAPRERIDLEAMVSEAVDCLVGG